MDRGRAAWAVDLVLLYCTAIAAEHGNGLNPGHPEGPLVPAIRGAREEDFPMIHASREELLAGTGDERVSWCIDVMLNGVLTTARPTPPAHAPTGPAHAPVSERGELVEVMLPKGSVLSFGAGRTPFVTNSIRLERRTRWRCCAFHNSSMSGRTRRTHRAPLRERLAGVVSKVLERNAR